MSVSIPDSPSYRQRLGYHAGLLGFFALLASTALMMSYLGTKEDIALRLKEDLKTTLGKVIPDQIYDNDMANDVITIPAPNLLSNNSAIEIFIARKDQQIVALAYQIVAPDGYSGPIVMMMGVNMQGEIIGVRIISHAETPGLGDKIEEKKSSWILSFDGLSDNNTKYDDWKVKKDGGKFDQLTGATITPRAIIKAIRRGLDFFNKQKANIIKMSMSPQRNTS